MNFLDFLLVELTWINLGFFLSAALGDIRTIYLSATCILRVFGTAQTAF